MDTLAAVASPARRGAAPVTPVTFTNQQGQVLFGIVHEPLDTAMKEAILLLSPGVKMRVAPHRLYNKMADRFVALGYRVLRFDFHGLGDSEGEAPESLLADLYGATQTGRYVADTVSAMDWMGRTFGTTRFIAAGLCGGALTGLLTAERDPRIIGLLALSIPVILDGANVDATRYLTTAQLDSTRAAYLGKLKPGAWRSWLRFLTLQSDYRMLARAVARPLLARLRARRGHTGPAPDAVPESHDNTNPLFAPAFRSMASGGRRMLLIFAETDRLLWEFEAKFMDRHGASLAPYRSTFQVHITPHANHIFSFSEWQQDMLDQCCRWLVPDGDEAVLPPGGEGA